MYLGIDPEGALALSGSLHGIAARAQSAAGDLVVAELLAELPTSVHPLLAEVEATVASVGARVSSASTQVASFQISLRRVGGARGTGHPTKGTGLSAIPDSRFQLDAQRAQELADEIRRAGAAGRAPDPGDFAELHTIIGQRTASPDTATLVAGLVLQGGVPAELALSLATADQIDLIFARVADAIDAHQSPTEAGLAAEWFPANYVAWHDIETRLDDLRAAPLETVNALTFAEWDLIPEVVERQAEIAELQALRLDLGLDQIPTVGGASPLDHSGDTSRFVAGSMVAAHLGSAANQSFGRYLATANIDQFVDEVDAISTAVASDPRVAVGYFAELKAEGTARLVFDATLGGRELYDVVIANFSHGLGHASRDPNLGFTGAELVAANDPLMGYSPLGALAPTAHVETLLLAPTFDHDWLTDAAGATFSQNWNGMADVYPIDSWVDPKLTAMVALVNNDAAPHFITTMAEQDRLHEVFNERASSDAPIQFGPGNDLVPHVFLAQVGGSSGAAAIVIDHLALKPDRVETDLAMANGLSTLLALNAEHYLVSGPDQESFFAVYDNVLHSGSGHDVSLIGGGDLIRQVLDGQLARDEAMHVDVTDMAEFVARVEATRIEVHQADAGLADLAATNQSNLLEQFGLGTGAVGVAVLVFAGPYAVAVGAIATVLGFGLALVGTGLRDSDEELDVMRRELGHNSERRDVITRQVLTAAFESGRVVDIAGTPVPPEFHAKLIEPGVVMNSDERLYGMTIDGVDLVEFVDIQLDVDDLIDDELQALAAEPR